MAHLGDFNGAIAELEPGDARDTFTFMGERFEIVGTAPPILTFQLGAGFTGKTPMVEAMGAMWELWQVSLGEEQFERFYRTAIEKRAHEETLVKLAIAIYEGRSKRPTVEPQGSTPGQSRTSPSSSDSSTHPALAHLRPVDQILTG
jgi:hypothetical protein